VGCCSVKFLSGVRQPLEESVRRREIRRWGNLSRALSTGKGNVRNYIIYEEQVYVMCVGVWVCVREENGEKGLALTAAVGAF